MGGRGAMGEGATGDGGRTPIGAGGAGAAAGIGGAGRGGGATGRGAIGGTGGAAGAAAGRGGAGGDIGDAGGAGGGAGGTRGEITGVGAGGAGGANGRVAAGGDGGMAGRTAGGTVAGAGVGAGGTAGGAGEGETARVRIGVGALLIVSGAVPGVCARGVNSSAAASPRFTVITPPQTAHRARTEAPGILAGSTRNTDRHSGHETFTVDLGWQCPRLRGRARRVRVRRQCGDRWNTRIRAGSWRSSSFPSRARSPGLRV